MLLETILQDLRIGFRVLIKEKSFCALAVIVLALGICGVTTMFSVVNGVMLRGMPFPEPAQLVDVQWRDPKQPPEVTSLLLPADYLELRPAQQSFTDLAAYLNLSTINITITRTPQRLQGAYITDNFFAVLGVKPAMGRDFTADDNRPEAARVALISHTTWQHEFNGDRGILEPGRPHQRPRRHDHRRDAAGLCVSPAGGDLAPAVQHLRPAGTEFPGSGRPRHRRGAQRRHPRPAEAQREPRAGPAGMERPRRPASPGCIPTPPSS